MRNMRQKTTNSSASTTTRLYPALYHVTRILPPLHESNHASETLVLVWHKTWQVYDPNFQHKGGKTKKGQEQGGISSQEGKLHMIRVKRLKFTLKGSNYEDAQNTALGGECVLFARMRAPACACQCA